MMYDSTAVELTGFAAVLFSEEDKSRGGGGHSAIKNNLHHRYSGKGQSREAA